MSILVYLCCLDKSISWIIYEYRNSIFFRVLKVKKPRPGYEICCLIRDLSAFKSGLVVISPKVCVGCCVFAYQKGQRDRESLSPFPAALL